MGIRFWELLYALYVSLIVFPKDSKNIGECIRLVSGEWREAIGDTFLRGHAPKATRLIMTRKMETPAPVAAKSLKGQLIDILVTELTRDSANQINHWIARMYWRCCARHLTICADCQERAVKEFIANQRTIREIEA